MKKSKKKAYLLWFFFGPLSAHRFYLDLGGSGIFYLLTLQLAGVGWIIDGFLVGRAVDRYNKRMDDEAKRRQEEWIKKYVRSTDEVEEPSLETDLVE